jgi:GntR family transcriptional regulator
MFVRIEKGSSTPISRQIAEQIRAQCLSGVLKPGTCLASVRELARQLAVNVNTVQRVYERMAAEGLIEMRHGDGTYVLPKPGGRNGARLLKVQREQYVREFAALVRQGVMLGLSEAELQELLSASVGAAQQHIGTGNGADASPESPI